MFLYLNTFKSLVIRSTSHCLPAQKVLLNYAGRHSCQPRILCRLMRISLVRHKFKEKRSLVHQTYFKNENRSKETFLEAINKFHERERQLRGHVEFIYSALNYLEEYGVHKDLEVYKSLIEIMPKGKMIPTNMFQEEFNHYPKHQECAIDVLEKMEHHGVLPDSELRDILLATFGKRGRPLFKFGRMMYWMPKFKNACPWPLPEILPDDALELAKLAIAQINSVDPASKITVMETSEVEDAVDKTWIVSAMSPHQVDLLARHPREKSIKVEGPFGIILREQRISYFILRADPEPPPPPRKRSEVDDVRSIWVWMTEEASEKEQGLIRKRSIHEQDDGTILATCATGTSSKDSLLSWIRLLEKTVPSLSKIPILFTQSSPIGDVIVSSQKDFEES